MLTYSFTVGDAESIEELVNVIRPWLGTKHQNVEKQVMTLAERIQQKGIQQGIEQGALQERFLLAKKMLVELKNLETVSRLTGLSVEELKKISH